MAMKNYSMICICSLSFMLFSLAGCGGNKNLPLPLHNAPIVYTPVTEDYYLQPGDNLEIKFFNNPELNENLTIRPDGKISLELIDEVQTAGLTPAQLDELLTEKYNSQLREVVITVMLKSFGGQKIYVGRAFPLPYMYILLYCAHILKVLLLVFVTFLT